MRNLFNWLGLAGLVLITCAVSIVLRARPAIEVGTTRPDWLPETASDILYHSQSRFGWWKAAQFTINEEDFKKFAANQEWLLTEQSNESPVSEAAMRLKETTPVNTTLIARALVFENLRINGGGLIVFYDRSTSRAYYSVSHP